MTLLAPLVHGRTFRLDFRALFIASPEGFDDSAVAWARRHILAMTSSSLLYKLEQDGLWWSVFSNDRYTVRGVLCRAPHISKDCHTDQGPRRLYAYLGLVSRNPVTFIPPMAIEHFAPLYQYVRERWEETSSDDLSAASYIPYRELDIPEWSGAPQRVELNRNPGAIALWPMEDKEAVWRWAHESAGVSAVIGPPFAGDMKKGIFGNVCSSEIAARRLEPLQPPKPKPQRESSSRFGSQPVSPRGVPAQSPSIETLPKQSPLAEVKGIFAKVRHRVQEVTEQIPAAVKRVVNPGNEVFEIWREEWKQWERQDGRDCIKVSAIVSGTLKRLDSSAAGEPGNLFRLFWNVLFESLDPFVIDNLEIGKRIAFDGSLNPGGRVIGVFTTMPGFLGCQLEFSGVPHLNPETVRQALYRALHVLVDPVCG